MSTQSSSSLFLIVFLTLQCFQTVSFGLEEPKKLYIVYLGEKQHEDPNVVKASHHEMLAHVHESKENALSSIVYNYKHGFSGFAAMLTDSQAKKIADLPEVISITPDSIVRLHTTRSWDFLGLKYLNHLPENILHKANYGEDIIIGVVDTGIWPESRSFDDVGYGPIPSRWRGTCQIGRAFNKTNCNRKIIGARFYANGVPKEILKQEYLSPRDFNGHGTHTASTAAGNLVANTSFNGLAAGMARGGAPRARLAIYKIIWGRGGGFATLAALMKAVDDAIHDRVDILSLSLGFKEKVLVPYATLHAVAKGMTVIFAAGNDGPAAQTVNNESPWVITVAASTIDRSFPTIITLGNNQKLVGQSMYYGHKRNNNFTELVIINDRCDEKLLNRTDIIGKIIVCSPPIIFASLPRVDISIAVDNAATAGVSGLIYAHYSTNILELTTSGQIPCVLIDFEVHDQISGYVLAESLKKSTPVVKIEPTHNVIGSEVLAPKVAAFSSRGPSKSFPGLLKPDIAAPGVGILAAKRDSYAFNTGTSMACPHVSGIAALLKSLRPDWSPAAIKSALMTTASITDAYGMPTEAESTPRKLADPFDFGGGHIDPNRAADPGLVYDIYPNDYLKFFVCGNINKLKLCGEATGMVDNLNLPSIAIPDLRNARSVWRTVTNVGQVDAGYKAVVEAPPGVSMIVEPSVLKFNATSKMQTFKLTFATMRKVQGDFKFGSLTWVEDYGTHTVRIPIAVRTVIKDFYADIA